MCGAARFNDVPLLPTAAVAVAAATGRAAALAVVLAGVLSAGLDRLHQVSHGDLLCLIGARSVRAGPIGAVLGPCGPTRSGRQFLRRESGRSGGLRTVRRRRCDPDPMRSPWVVGLRLSRCRSRSHSGGASSGQSECPHSHGGQRSADPGTRSVFSPPGAHFGMARRPSVPNSSVSWARTFRAMLCLISPLVSVRGVRAPGAPLSPGRTSGGRIRARGARSHRCGPWPQVRPYGPPFQGLARTCWSCAFRHRVATLRSGGSASVNDRAGAEGRKSRSSTRRSQPEISQSSTSAPVA